MTAQECCLNEPWPEGFTLKIGSVWAVRSPLLAMVVISVDSQVNEIKLSAPKNLMWIGTAQEFQQQCIRL